MTEKLHDFQVAFHTPPPETPTDGFVRKSRALHLVSGVIAAAAIVAAVMCFVLGAARVSGNSMAPAYRDSTFVWFVRGGSTFSRGTVVSVTMPSGDHYIKRVVAGPGDTVDIADGKLIVNGKTVDEPYARGRTERQADGLMVYPYKLPASKYFVLGDNRAHSADSRIFGPVSAAQIQGRIVSTK
jgi:signal peptidase I